MIQEYYFNDMLMQLENEKSMLYTLPRKIVTTLDELDKNTLIGIVPQAFENKIPEIKFNNDSECITYMEPLAKILQEKYNIEVNNYEGCFKVV